MDRIDDFVNAKDMFENLIAPWKVEMNESSKDLQRSSEKPHRSLGECNMKKNEKGVHPIRNVVQDLSIKIYIYSQKDSHETRREMIRQGEDVVSTPTPSQTVTRWKTATQMRKQRPEMIDCKTFETHEAGVGVKNRARLNACQSRSPKRRQITREYD